jgi:hypothetical protein
MDYIDPAEFVNEENLNYKEKGTSEDEGVNKDDKQSRRRTYLLQPPQKSHHPKLFAAGP